MSERSKTSMREFVHRWRSPLLCALAAGLALTLILGHSIYRERDLARKIAFLKTGMGKAKVLAIMGPADKVFAGPPPLPSDPLGEMWQYGKPPRFPPSLSDFFFPSKLVRIKFNAAGSVIEIE